MTRDRSIFLLALCSSIAAPFTFAGCSGETDADEGTAAVTPGGSNTSATPTPSSPGGATGGTPASTGGTPASPGGVAGGTPASPGGTPPSTGDAPGGTPSSTGDAPGETPASTGDAPGETPASTEGAGGSPMDAPGGDTPEPGAAGAGGMSALGGDGGASSGGTPGEGEGGAAAGGASMGAGGSDGGDTPSNQSAGCGTEPGIASNMYNNGNPIPISAGGRDRRYILSVPDDYDNTRPYNLVIAWHQLDGNDKQMYDQNFYWIKDIPEAASSTIFVAPNGEKNGTPCTGMSVAEGGCGWPDSNGSNVALADAVVAEVEANFCIDKNRIFANGWSYGGSMSYRTACSRPLDGGEADWGVRAVAVYNGAAQLSSGGCMPSKSVAFYASHGTDDNVLGYDGGVSMATTYAELNGCMVMTPTRANGNHVCTNFMGCEADYPVEFCSFVGPHTPDPPREGGQRWQPQEVWQFFSAL